MPAPATSSICLSIPQAAVIRDSLRALPLVRKEASAWRYAASRYKYAADTAYAAQLKQSQASANLRLVLREQRIAITQQTARADKWQAKARKRGLLNWLALGVAGGIVYSLLR